MFYGVAQVPEPASSQSQAFQAFYDILEVCWSILSSLKTKKKRRLETKLLDFPPHQPNVYRCYFGGNECKGL